MRDALPVVIFSTLQDPSLVFHRYLSMWGRPNEPDIRHGSTFTSKTIQVLSSTDCGLVVFYCTYDVEREEHNRDGRMRGTLIRYGHALKIADPCKKCFPNHPKIYRSYDEYLEEVRAERDALQSKLDQCFENCRECQIDGCPPPPREG